MEASSRIFVKGLPPSFTEVEFKKHFSRSRPVTDAKIFPNRRIGYVGFKTPEDAQKAVKYFNKTFIRMSRIGVELARPVQDAPPGQRSRGAPTARRDSASQPGGVKRKRETEQEEQDPKLKEFLDAYKPKSKTKAWEAEEPAAGGVDVAEPAVAAGAEDASDDEYEVVPKKAKKTQVVRKEADDPPVEEPADAKEEQIVIDQSEPPAAEAAPAFASDADWARSRTSRLLGLLDDDDEELAIAQRGLSKPNDSGDDDDEDDDEDDTPSKGTKKSQAVNQIDTAKDATSQETDVGLTDTVHEEENQVRTTMRLFIRNLPYTVQTADVEALFGQYGHLEAVHVSQDTKTGAGKGFAYVQFSDPDAAERALQEQDGQIFHGRLIHILPATAKRETRLDDFALSKLPLKKQQDIKKRREASSASFNWNALYMNADTVVSSVASRLGIDKSAVLDPTSSDAAVKQAHAETHIIQETKAYFKQHGVDLDSFKRSQRGDTAILAKNIPFDCSKDELRRLFEEHGEVKRFLMPPSGTVVIVEYPNASQCKTAFGALAYRKIKGSVLFLEKAPKDVFNGAAIASSTAPGTTDTVTKKSVSELKNEGSNDSAATATLFVRNLNFSTTTPKLTETFRALDGFLSARVKTKTDPKKPGEILSMGFGFLEFQSAKQAEVAMRTMDGYSLEGHKLQIRSSHKGADSAENRRKADAAKRAANKQTKVIIKNLPFEATKKDVRSLFGAYGQLRSVRVPKKMDRGARGFAFADFTTPKEAENAMDALKDTHLLGRRLVLDFAAEDPEDAEAEIERMQQKVGAQVNKVALQNLTSGGRKRFTTQNDNEDEA